MIYKFIIFYQVEKLIDLIIANILLLLIREKILY